MTSEKNGAFLKTFIFDGYNEKPFPGWKKQVPPRFGERDLFFVSGYLYMVRNRRLSFGINSAY